MDRNPRFPSKVRSDIGDAKDGNCEIFLHDTMYYFQKGRLVQQRKAVHTVLLLGFDVYLQEPQIAIDKLAADGVDLDKICHTTGEGRPAYVVGAAQGDLSTPQFWIDRERLVLVRAIRKSVRGGLVDIGFDGFERCGDRWLATELVFKRNGQPLTFEVCLKYSIPDRVDPEIFNIDELKTQFQAVPASLSSHVALLTV